MKTEMEEQTRNTAAAAVAIIQGKTTRRIDHHHQSLVRLQHERVVNRKKLRQNGMDQFQS